MPMGMDATSTETNGASGSGSGLGSKWDLCTVPPQSAGPLVDYTTIIPRSVAAWGRSVKIFDYPTGSWYCRR